jgi:predicted nucleic acid-binding Zn ribbon protein
MAETVAIRRFPTKLYCRCAACGHQGVVQTYINTSPKLKCSRCGARNPHVGGRDFLRRWANQRRGR